MGMDIGSCTTETSGFGGTIGNGGFVDRVWIFDHRLAGLAVSDRSFGSFKDWQLGTL